ncbi:MAG TPA: hypothetical protein VJG66_00015 [Patescibacteria group bacterium]|nr:hypothetical protein [Patescibacteria group bacterium]
MQVLIESERRIIVGKAGGTSTADFARLQRQHEIIQADPRRKIWVLSAPGALFEGDTKISRQLAYCHELFKDHASSGQIATAFDPIISRYLDIANGFNSRIVEEEANQFLEQTLGGIILGKWNPGQTVVRGEYGIARLAALGWNATFVDPTAIFRIKDDGSFDPQTAKLIKERFSQIDGLAIVPGCYGSAANDPDKTVMFDWGGSDITADLIAEQVGDGHENWTDVKGVKAVDPKDIAAEDRENIPTIYRVTYEEMLVLAQGGAKVLHPRAILGCRRAGLPINIRDSFYPENPGTLIVSSREVPEDERVIAIARDPVRQTVTLVGSNLGNPRIRAEVLERSILALGNELVGSAKIIQDPLSLTFNLSSVQSDQALRSLYTEFFS